MTPSDNSGKRRLVTNAAVLESLLSAKTAERLHQIILENDANSQ